MINHIEANSRTAHCRLLKQAGYKVLGTGLFSTVFEVPDNPDIVIKVMKHTDYAYLTFAEHVMKHPNIHFPKIHSIDTYNASGRFPYVVCVIERVDVLRYSFKREFFASQLDDYCRGVTLYVDRKQFPLTAEFNQAVDTLRMLYETHLGSFDIHHKNIGYRKDGTLVIIDPFC